MPIPHFRQGDLDGLCGIYALLNAIFQKIYRQRLLAYKHSDEHFANAIACIPKSNLHRVIINGLGVDELFFIAKKFCRKILINDKLMLYPSLPYKEAEFDSVTKLRKELMNEQNSTGCAFILAINFHARGEYTGGHWTALRKVDAGGFHVINNNGANYIRGRKLRVSPGATNEIEYKSVIRLDVVNL